MTLQQEIEKILNEEVKMWYAPLQGQKEATCELQKLFLSKQIELLNGIDKDGFGANAAIIKKRKELESELKELQ